MKRYLLISLAVTTAMLTNVTSTDAAQLSLTAQEHGWRSDYNQALADARKMKKPLMVVFRCVP